MPFAASAKVVGKQRPPPPPPKEIQTEAIIAADGTVIKPKPYIIGRPERDIIIESNFDSVRDIHIHERHQLIKWVLFATCALCDFAGLMVILYALALTKQFSGKNKDPNWKIFAGGCAMFAPFFIWLFFLFCVFGKERIRRSEMNYRRRVRRKYEKLREDYFNGDLEEDAAPVLDKYGMVVKEQPSGRTSGAFGKKRSLASAALSAMGDKSNDGSGTGSRPVSRSSLNSGGRSGFSWAASFVSGERRRLDGTAGRESKGEETDPIDQFAAPPPAPGGIRLTDATRNDPTIVSLVMPRKSRARVRDSQVTPEVKPMFDASEVQNEYSHSSIAKYIVAPEPGMTKFGPPASVQHLAALRASQQLNSLGAVKKNSRPSSPIHGASTGSAAGSGLLLPNKPLLAPIKMTSKSTPTNRDRERNSFRQNSMTEGGAGRTSVKFAV